MDISSGGTGILWAPLVVAIAFFAMLCLIIVVAIIRYSADEVSKPLSAISGLLGGVLAMIGTYYFQSKQGELVRAQDLNSFSQYKKVAVEDYRGFYEDYEELEKENLTLREQLDKLNSPP